MCVCVYVLCVCAFLKVMSKVKVKFINQKHFKNKIVCYF